MSTEPLAHEPEQANPGLAGLPSFDDHNPPSADLIADCVHCGFCLPTCPTYVLWGEEMDSPRGRIYLMKEGLQGEPLTDSMVSHFDACLGCMACVTACPSGVQYNRLIEATRAQVERNHQRTPQEKAVRSMIFATFPHPKRLRALRGPLRAYQKIGGARLLRGSGVLEKISPQLAVMEGLAPDLGKVQAVPERTPARGTRRGTVGMLLGCVQREFFPGVNAATARVLAAEGFDVIAPKAQGCCGALSIHSGREAEGQAYARRLIDTFTEANVDYIVVNAAGCGSSMKEYADLLAEDSEYKYLAQRFAEKVRDVSEILIEQGTVARYHPLDVNIAYHDACHLAHAQGVRSQPRQLLSAIPGLRINEIAESEVCCGSAGIYNILEPEPSRQLGDRKAANVARTGAELLVTANPGCLMQISAALERQGKQIHMAHTVEVLDASQRALPGIALRASRVERDKQAIADEESGQLGSGQTGLVKPARGLNQESRFNASKRMDPGEWIRTIRGLFARFK